MTTLTNTEALDHIADRIAYKYLDRTFGSAKLKSDILSALRNEREARLELTERERQILIDHHNYEAEKAITRLGCRTTERYHRNRVKAIREGR